MPEQNIIISKYPYDCNGSPIPPKVTLLITMNSSMPYLLPSRPNPLCLTPPNLEKIISSDPTKKTK